MTKADLIEKITKGSNLEPTTVSAVIESLFETIKEQVAKGEEITFRNFGSFKAQHTKPKKARVIKRDESILIPARTLPKFIPAKEFVDNVKSKVK